VGGSEPHLEGGWHWAPLFFLHLSPALLLHLTPPLTSLTSPLGRAAPENLKAEQTWTGRAGRQAELSSALLPLHSLLPLTLFFLLGLDSEGEGE